MKKLVATILTMLSCQAAWALPVGNPAEASLFLNGAWWDGYCCDPCDPCFSWCDAWSVRVGYYGDFVFNRHMELENRDRSFGADIDQLCINTNAGYLALNICDRLDVFATLGASKIRTRTDSAAFIAGATTFETQLNYRSEFSWSVGGRGTLWQCDCWFVGLEGQYFQTNPDLDNLVRYDTGRIIYFNDNNDIRYSEWQVGLGIAYRIATSCPTLAMVPYTAVRWGRSHLDHNNLSFVDAQDTFNLNDQRSKKLWGYAVGMSLTLCDIIGVTAEGRWGSEKAFHINGQFRF